MKQREETIQNYINGYNEFNPQKMLESLASDIIFENIQNGVTTDSLVGRDAFLQQSEMASEYFSARHQKINSMKHFEDYTEIEVDYEATLAEDFSESAKKGDKIKLQGKSIFTFNSENKIQKLLDIS